MKLLRALLHETMESVKGSSTISNVFVRNGGGPTSCSPSIGWGVMLEDDEEEEEEHAAVPAATDSSAFTFSSSIALIGSDWSEIEKLMTVII